MFTGRAVQPGDPQWTAKDTALAIALHEAESMICAGCGSDRRESMDAANEFKYQAEPIRCHGCATRDRASESMSATKTDMKGLNFIVKRRT